MTGRHNGRHGIDFQSRYPWVCWPQADHCNEARAATAAAGDMRSALQVVNTRGCGSWIKSKQCRFKQAVRDVACSRSAHKIVN